MIRYQTANCVQCGKPATRWIGGVLNGKEKILAGWCKKHPSSGFYGQYKNWMGKIDLYE